MQPGHVQEREGRRLLGIKRRQVRAGKQDSLRATPVDQVAGGPLQEGYLYGRPALSEQRDIVVHCTHRVEDRRFQPDHPLPGNATLPVSIQWSGEKSLSISQDKAYAVVGRPATPASVA